MGVGVLVGVGVGVRVGVGVGVLVGVIVGMGVGERYPGIEIIASLYIPCPYPPMLKAFIVYRAVDLRFGMVTT